ncbi:hypothetical protein JL720_15267 [Aureococcus anophagefferens]|nr:hypothetical protein JL720_15267 [Aureococcus anophagefferens]
MPMACLMNASAPCDTSYGGWQAPMVAAVANGSATPVLQDDGAAWSAIGAGHDDVVLYDDACRAFAAAKKNVADVEDDAGFRAVAVLAGAAASAAGGAGVCRETSCFASSAAAAARGGAGGYALAIFLSSFLTGGLVVRFYVSRASASPASSDPVFSPLGFGAQMVRRRPRSRSGSDDDDDDDDFDDIAL